MTAHPATPASRITQDQVTWFAHTFDQLVGNVEKAVLGKEHVTRLALTCLLSEGHLLLEDVPGTGQDAAGPGALPPRCRARTAASSSRPTCCRATSPA